MRIACSKGLVCTQLQGEKIFLILSVVAVQSQTVKAILPNKPVCLIEHSRNTATEWKPHRGRRAGVVWEAGHQSFVLTFFMYSVVMALLLRSIAPSATIMIFSRFIPARFYKGGCGGET